MVRARGYSSGDGGPHCGVPSSPCDRLDRASLDQLTLGHQLGLVRALAIVPFAPSRPHAGTCETRPYCPEPQPSVLANPWSRTTDGARARPRREARKRHLERRRACDEVRYNFSAAIASTMGAVPTQGAPGTSVTCCAMTIPLGAMRSHPRL